MKNLLFALMLTVLGTFFINESAIAQSLEPVKWTHEVVKLDDGSFQVDFTANVDKGWYLYSQNIEEGGPQPTTIEFAGKGVEVAKEIAEKGDLKEGFDELFEMDIRKYGDKVVFSANVKPLHSKVNKTTASVRFMCCDNTRCLPPTTIDFEVELK